MEQELQKQYVWFVCLCCVATVGDVQFQATIIYQFGYFFNMSQLTIGGGLDNLGNTCFFNATLQSVLHTRALATILTQHQHSHICRLKQQRQWCCFCEMENIFAATRQAKRYAPNSMINHLKSIFKKFKLGRQEDSHEFLRYLVEGMQEAETGKAGKEKDAKEALEGRIKASKIFGVFGGIMKTCVDCLNCNNKSITTERYYDFNIECQRSNTLLEGINSFFAVDKLEGNNKYLCEHCKIRSNARKRFLLDTVPQVATFQMKRFTNSLRKIGKFIQFPLTIDLGKFLEIPHKALMKLYAIVVHAGGSSYSGHYYAFVRVGEAWYKMDDGYVSKCSQESVLSQSAYLLFYEKTFEEESKKPANQINGNEVVANHVPKVKETKNEQRKQKKQQQKVPEASINKPQKDTEIEITDDIKHNILQKLQSHPNSEIRNHINSILSGLDNPNEPRHGDWSDQSRDKTHEKQEEKIQEEITVPNSLKRRKSKEQMEHDMPHQELIMHTLTKLLQLSAKLPYTRPHNRSQRQLYSLRKYETIMQKKRKLG